MFVWEPTSDGQTRCRRHPEVDAFAKGHTCPGCDRDPPPDDDDETSRAPVAHGLPAVVEHERWYVEVSDRFKLEAFKMLVDRKVASGKGKRKKVIRANPLGAAKLVDVAIKARRAAVESAKWREDWQNVEQLERELVEMRRMRGAH